MNTHNVICDFGRHKGELYTRMPINYLKWMINANHGKADIAKAELERRGTTTPELDITGHAIDRASIKLLQIWLDQTSKKIGFHSWLHDQAKKAIDKPKNKKGNHIWLSHQWCFDMDGEWPVLKTII